MPPQNREHADSERDVGRSRNCPAADEFGIEARDSEIDQRGDYHSGNCGKDRQAALGRARQSPVEPFALHFESDEQEEDRHQPVRHPLVKTKHSQPRECRTEAKLEQMMISRGPRRIRGP